MELTDKEKELAAFAERVFVEQASKVDGLIDSVRKDERSLIVSYLLELRDLQMAGSAPGWEARAGMLRRAAEDITAGKHAPQPAPDAGDAGGGG
jgi:hypothetical protein